MTFLRVRVFVGCNLSSGEIIDIRVKLAALAHLRAARVAKKRDHPHQDAIHIAGWVSLFLLHTIWPLLWIWAYLYKPGEKFLQMEVTGAGSEEQQKRIEQLEAQVLAISAALKEFVAAASEDMTGENPNG